MLTKLKVVYNKLTSGERLTDEEVNEGVNLFPELIHDLAETGMFDGAVAEARKVLDQLKELKKERGC